MAHSISALGRIVDSGCSVAMSARPLSIWYLVVRGAGGQNWGIFLGDIPPCYM